MNNIIGKWVQVEGQPYEGLWFEFLEDGTFKAQYDPMSIESSGTYKVAQGEIIMQQTTHTFGMVGEFKGIYQVDGDQLKMALASGPGQEAPENLSEARIYQKE